MLPLGRVSIEPRLEDESLILFCTGAFDVIAELWPHIAMIFYRTHNSNHRFLARLFFATMWLELFGTLVETVVMMTLFGLLWQDWSLSLNIATPLLHLLFSCAQLWGAWIFYGLAKQQQGKSRKKELDSDRDGSSCGPSEESIR